MTPEDVREDVQRLVAPHNAAVPLTSRHIDAVAHQVICEMALAARPPSLRKEADQNLTASTSTYKLPADFFLPITVRVLAGSQWGNVGKVTQEELDQALPNWPNETSSGDVLHYYETGVYTTNDADYGKRQIVLWPTPSQTVTNGLRVRYLRRPSKFSELPTDQSEIVDIDSAHHFGIVYRTAWRILQAQGVKAVKVLDAYEGMWASALSNLKTHHSEEWLADYEPQVRAFRGAGIDRSFTR